MRYRTPVSKRTRNLYAWKERTEDGRKRQVEAQLFGARWKLSSICEDEEEWTNVSPTCVAPAFSHYCYSVTGGKEMVVDIQGEFDAAANVFRLTDPRAAARESHQLCNSHGAPSPYLGRISVASRPHLGRISAVSRPHLAARGEVRRC